MSCWINQQQPQYLNDADQALVEKDLELQSAIQWQADLKTQCNDCIGDPALQDMLDDQEHKVSNLHCCLQDKQQKEACCEFSQKQVVIDIERQLTGSTVSDKPAHEVLQKEFTMPPEQILLVETFFTWLTTDSLEDEWECCNKAVAAGIQYCGFQEGGPLQGQSKHSALSDDKDQVPSLKTQKRTILEEQPTASWEKEYDSSRKHILSAEKPLTCFQCFKKYSDYNGVKRHFKTSHLMDHKCNFCNLLVLHEMHLQRHAQDVHCLKT